MLKCRFLSLFYEVMFTSASLPFSPTFVAFPSTLGVHRLPDWRSESLDRPVALEEAGGATSRRGWSEGDPASLTRTTVQRASHTTRSGLGSTGKQQRGEREGEEGGAEQWCRQHTAADGIVAGRPGEGGRERRG